MEELSDILLEGEHNISVSSHMQLFSFTQLFSPCHQPVLQYMIFPLQFAYLYSYYPSGSIREIAQKLQEEWKTKHMMEAEDAFALVREEGQKISGPSFFKKVETPATVLAATKQDRR
jgi:hypothetical protein